MLEINSIYLKRMLNNEHFQFMTDVNSLMVLYKPEMLGIQAQYPAFEAALAEEDLRMKAEQGSLKSLSISQLDGLRDRTWNAIKGRVKSTLDSPFETEQENARALKRVIDLYGDVRHMSYNAETAAISNLVNDLKSVENAGYLLSVGVGPWIDELEKQNKTFIEQMDARNKEYADRESGDVRSARLVIDPIYTEIVDRLNAMLLLNIASDEVTPFVKELNEKIKYYEKVVKARESKNKSKSDEIAEAQADV